MKNKQEALQQSLNAVLSGLQTTPRQRDRFFDRATGESPIKRKPVLGVRLALIIALMIAMTGAALALTRGFGIFDFASSHRKNVEVPPDGESGILRDLKTVDCGHATVVFREAAYDGMTCHLVYDVIPHRTDMLLFDCPTDDSWYGLTHLDWDEEALLADERTILDRWEEGGYASAWEVDFDVGAVDGASYEDAYGGMGGVLDEGSGTYTGTVEIPFRSFQAERTIRLYVRLLPLNDLHDEYSYDYDRSEIAVLEYTFHAEEGNVRVSAGPVPLPGIGVTVNDVRMTVLPREIVYQITYAVTDPAAFHAAFDRDLGGFIHTDFPQFRFVSMDPESGAVTFLPEGITFEFSQNTIDAEKGLYVQRGTLGLSAARDTYTLAVFRDLYAEGATMLETVSLNMRPQAD
ncbi:MAG: hypothetical protein IJ662_14075 [Clostridia bacterium]|nr:hypothetical protein [Clostridia bacterium]MBR1586664.1 hypothetical protein [Clostridia bacterium]